MTAHFSNAMLPQIRELMSNGKTPTQIAAFLHVSKQDLMGWLMDPDSQYDELRREVELGLTACEAFWESKGQAAILGQIKYFRDKTFALFMQNRFKWVEKTEVEQTIRTQEQLLPDDLLNEQIALHIEKHNDGQRQTKEIDSGERPPDKPE
jgi:hypothetical protein